MNSFLIIYVNTRDDVSCDSEEKGKFPTVKGFLSGLKSRSPARLYSLRSPRAVVYCCVLTLLTNHHLIGVQRLYPFCVSLVTKTLPTLPL